MLLRGASSPSVSHSMAWDKDLSRGMSTLLQFLFGNKTCLSCSVTNHNALFLHALDVGLVVAPDTITDCHEGELTWTE